MIRGKSKKCPFGLPITNGCKTAGLVIRRLTPVELADGEEEAKAIMEENLEIWNEAMLAAAGEEIPECPFADMTFKKKIVDCKYDPDNPDLSTIPAGNVGLNGSPLYPHIMIGNMPEAQYGYPLDYYSDNNESRNVYYGLYSLIG